MTDPTFGTQTAHTPEFPHVLSSSIREAFSICPRKFQWEQINGWIPQGDNQHLKFGSAYAAGLEVYRKSYYGAKYRSLSLADRLSNALADGIHAAILDYGDYEPPEGSAKNYERLIGALVEYTLQYPPETDSCKPSMFQGEPRVEFSFTIETKAKESSRGFRFINGDLEISERSIINEDYHDSFDNPGSSYLWIKGDVHDWTANMSQS